MTISDKKIFCGVDVGASATKVVLIDGEGRLLGYNISGTGAEAGSVAGHCRDEMLKELGLVVSDITGTGSTGYARDDVDFADLTRTEISCHGRGCLQYFPGPFSIVDIGGQDNKIIRLNEEGKRTGFKLNRKCAAGTGSFLEEIAGLLKVPVDELNGLAEKAEKPVKLGSFCTVFTKTEILTNFRRGDSVPDIVAGAFESVVRRIIEMDPLDGEIVLTGGVVAHNPYIIGVFEKTLGRKMKVPPKPQLTGAIGAALFAIENERGE
ncbi:MAG: acyl-CoA dehydratase activase [bacterium]